MSDNNFKKEYRVISSKKINHNCIIIQLSPIDLDVPSFPVSSFVYIYDDKGNRRPYTPINILNKYLEFAIKVYPNGLLSSFIKEKKVNDILEVSNPISQKEYKPNEFKRILMLAVGTGITPMLQILDYSNKNCDTTFFDLIFCNLTVEDILLKERLDQIKNVDVKYVFGNITLHDISKDEYDFCYVCGPPMFMMVTSGLKKLQNQGELQGFLKLKGFRAENVYKF